MTVFETDRDLDGRLLRALSLHRPKLIWQLSGELRVYSTKVAGRLRALVNCGRAKKVTPDEWGVKAFRGDPTGTKSAWVRLPRR